MKPSKFSQERILHDVRPARSGTLNGNLYGSLCRSGDIDLLHLEKEVCASGRERASPVATGGRENCSTQTAGGGCVSDLGFGGQPAWHLDIETFGIPRWALSI